MVEGRSYRRRPRRRRRAEEDTEGTNYACRIAFDFALVIDIEMTLLTSSCYCY